MLAADSQDNRSTRRTSTARHGRRPIRSSLTGAQLPDPQHRVARFDFVARAALELVRREVGAEIADVQFGFTTAPSSTVSATHNPLYSIDRASRTIMLHRIPIQRASGLHVDDEAHRRMFIGHCVHRAICEYLDREPWEILPGYFDHF